MKLEYTGGIMNNASSYLDVAFREGNSRTKTMHTCWGQEVCIKQTVNTRTGT